MAKGKPRMRLMVWKGLLVDFGIRQQKVASVVAAAEQYQLELQVESFAQFSAQQMTMCIEAANGTEMASLKEAMLEAEAALQCQLEADETMRIETSRMEAELKGLVELEEIELLSLNTQLVECAGQQRQQQLQLTNAKLAECGHQLVQCQEEKVNAAEVARVESEATTMDNNAHLPRCNQ